MTLILGANVLLLLQLAVLASCVALLEHMQYLRVARMHGSMRRDDEMVRNIIITDGRCKRRLLVRTRASVRAARWF